jgi:hypothetical protein
MLVLCPGQGGTRKIQPLWWTVLFYRLKVRHSQAVVAPTLKPISELSLEWLVRVAILSLSLPRFLLLLIHDVQHFQGLIRPIFLHRELSSWNASSHKRIVFYA